jgi:Putative peptidoglycan binding domain
MTYMNRKIILPISIVTGLGLGWGGFEAYHAPRILPGVSAAGVSVGGLTLFEASSKLKAAFKTQTPPTITVRAGEKSLEVAANEMGWKPNAQSTAQSAFNVGRNQGFFENFAKRFSSVNVPLLAQVDETQFQSRVKTLSQPFTVAARNAAIVVAEGKYVVRKDTSGQSLDFAGAIKNFVHNPNLTELELQTVNVPAALTKADLEPIAEKANLLVRNLVLQYKPPGTDKNLVQNLSAEEVRNLFFVKRDGLISDNTAIAKTLNMVGSRFDRDPVNARYKSVGANFIKTKDQLGFKLDQTVALKLVASEILNPETTQIVLPVVVNKPSITSQSLPDPKIV